MDPSHQRGRPRSQDSILLAIKAICLEAKHLEAHMDGISRNFIQRIRASYGHGTAFAQNIYIQKIKEIEAELNKGGRG